MAGEPRDAVTLTVALSRRKASSRWVSVSKQRPSRLRGAGEPAAFECAESLRPVGQGIVTQRHQIMRRCDAGDGAS